MGGIREGGSQVGRGNVCLWECSLVWECGLNRTHSGEAIGADNPSTTPVTQLYRGATQGMIEHRKIKLCRS